MACHDVSATIRQVKKEHWHGSGIQYSVLLFGAIPSATSIPGTTYKPHTIYGILPRLLHTHLLAVPIPLPTSDSFRTRAFVRLTEATFTYGFWAVYCVQGDTHYYRMKRLSFWDRRAIAWGSARTPLYRSRLQLSRYKAGLAGVSRSTRSSTPISSTNAGRKKENGTKHYGMLQRLVMPMRRRGLSRLTNKSQG